MSATWALRSFDRRHRFGALEVAAAAGVIGETACLQLTYRLHGYATTGDVELHRPERAPSPTRRDGLWRHTCAELFVRDPTGPGYLEFNFSPSGDWAAYAFEAPRQGQTTHRWPQDEAASAQSSVPQVGARWMTDSRDRSASVFELQVALAWRALARGGSDRWPTLRPIALSFVIETRAGLEYWALAHPASQPDFHHPDGFVGQLEVPACV